MSEPNLKTSVGARVRQIRQNRDLEPEHLAEEIGESVEYLTKLENDEFNPPVAMIIRLAQALKVDSMVLLKEMQDREAANRHQEAVSKRTANYAYDLLAPEFLQKHLKSFMVTLEPSSSLEGPGYQHQGEEYHYVLEGDLKVSVGDETHLLGPGQSLYFDSSLVHQLHNAGETPCKVLVVLYTP